MSLDVYLKLEGQKTIRSGIFIRENGQTKEISHQEWDEKFPDREPLMASLGDYVYSNNITHNLYKMATEANLYNALWEPENIPAVIAEDLIPYLVEGLKNLYANRTFLEIFNPSNGWGNYEILVDFTESYLLACIKYPKAKVEVSR